MILTNQAKNAMLRGLADVINGSGSATLTLYESGVAVAAFVMPSPIEQSISGGKIVFNLPESALAGQSVTPTTAKLTSGAGVDMLTLDVGTDLILDSSGIYAGGNVTITDLSIQI